MYWPSETACWKRRAPWAATNNFGMKGHSPDGLSFPGPCALNCTNIKGDQNLMMLTVSAAPKIKFMEGSKLRPWIIPAGLDINVISPPSDSTNYLDVGVQFAAGLDYEIMPGITIGRNT